MSGHYKQPWPDDFDFDTDPVCQNVFRPFIESEMEKLAAYDAQRPKDRKYIFPEHAQRVADNVKRTCLHMDLSEAVANNMYWAVLPHDIGKRLLPIEIWDSTEKPTDETKKFRRTHTLLGVQIVQEMLPAASHPFKALMCDIMMHHHEQMNGEGTHNVPDEKLSAPVRLVSIVEAYDGWRIWRPHYGDRDITPPGVIKRMREEKGPDFFDMELFEAFAEMTLQGYKKP